ncbi:GMC oxidoreductase [Sorangium sp. So ce1182]|uniref:GMC oxidoreductase n=1 Tax=Sorangium sp. So ce1182 TaxID=3133334 RepID=UPI003F62EC60
MFTKDVIVLVPGLFGFGVFGEAPRRISYFDRVGDTLAAALGVPASRIVVHAPRPTAPFTVRVGSLWRRIVALLEEGLPDGPVERIHLVGHSTGGVDVRLLVNTRFLWSGGPVGHERSAFLDRIGALVSVSAPHHGSPIARRLRAGAELVLPAVTMLSILAKSAEPAAAARLMPAITRGVLAASHLGAAAKVLAFLTDGSAGMTGDIVDYVKAVHNERILIDELMPLAMSGLNRTIAGGEARPVVDYVTVSPPPSPRLVVSPVELGGRLLYTLSYMYTRPEASERVPFPEGSFIGSVNCDTAALRTLAASDGVVPCASQAFSGVAEALVAGDHLDGVGHFDSAEYFGVPIFKSDAAFDDERFEYLWKHVARTINRWRTTRPPAAASHRAAIKPSPAASRAAGEGADGIEEFDYIVVGSGAGGGPVACNLARAGMRVLLLEAGEDAEGPIYDVPAFHPRASEDPGMNWSFFVRHYRDSKRAARDSKYVAEQGGVLYPRGATVGGCTAHNAMITIYPHASDWDRIAELTGDPSWLGARMRSYFERIEMCRYVERPRGGAENVTRHGFNGWLTVYQADPKLLLGDGALLAYLSTAVKVVLHGSQGNVLQMLERARDPNDGRMEQGPSEGVYLTPIATTRSGRRVGARERIRETQWLFPGLLTVRAGALASRVLVDEQRRAHGVEYIDGARAYRADRNAAPADRGTTRLVYARKEVIVAAGAFNSPQLLMLSGIGPADELKRHGVEVKVPLDGVGSNLQDRYEVGVVSRMRKPFPLLRDVSFAPPVMGRPLERAYRDWLDGKGLYTTNGVVLSIIRKSRPDAPEPDLFIFGLPGYFRGYYPGYSEKVAERKDMFTWAILKAHTDNHAGRVTLRSADPRDTPVIDFCYFDEGNDAAGGDLGGVIEGIKLARRINTMSRLLVKEEVVPGPKAGTDSELAQFVKDEAWGHHACGTNKMGPATDPTAVVDSRFRVHGVRNLRVVDASIFPRIPGFFIVSAIYMIAEKASDAILEDALQASRSSQADRPAASVALHVADRAVSPVPAQQADAE